MAEPGSPWQQHDLLGLLGLAGHDLPPDTASVPSTAGPAPAGTQAPDLAGSTSDHGALWDEASEVHAAAVGSRALDREDQGQGAAPEEHASPDGRIHPSEGGPAVAAERGAEAGSGLVIESARESLEAPPEAVIGAFPADPAAESATESATETATEAARQAASATPAPALRDPGPIVVEIESESAPAPGVESAQAAAAVASLPSLPADPPAAPSVAPAIALPPLATSPRRSAFSSPSSPVPTGPFPQRILILDTETTALSPDQGQVIEVGAVLFHVPSRQLLQQISFLLPCGANGAEAINGIPAAVSRLPQPLEPALACFAALVEAADALLAHNAAFDRQWFGRGALPALSLPWICSMEDIRWPAERQLRGTPSVRDLALAYGVPVWAAHRALTDCQYLVQVFERCPELESLLTQALEPRQLYRARLSYAERHRAREAGFRWNEPVAGAWSRRLSQREVEALPFPVVPVEAPDLRGEALPRSA
jgi:DNA polymerase-3 subunit epsilon